MELTNPTFHGSYFYTLSTESTRDSVTAGDFTTTRNPIDCCNQKPTKGEPTRENNPVFHNDATYAYNARVPAE